MPTDPRRILLLVTDLEIGGTPTVVRELAIRLARAGGAAVHVACLGRFGPVAGELRDAGVPVTVFDAAGVWAMPAVVAKLVRLARRERIEVILSFLVHANAVAALAKAALPGVRLIESIQTTQPTPRWHWPVQRLAARATEAVIVPSPSVAAVAEAWAGVPAERVRIVPNAIDLAEYEPIYARRQARPAGRPFVVGFVGRLDPIKNVPDLIAAMRYLPTDATLHVVGDGPERGRLESLVKPFGPRVLFNGPAARATAFLETFDVLVLPSSAEGFGLVLIEAMSAGVPIVATNAPGIRDVVQDGATGLLVPVHDPPALADAIRRVLPDGPLRQRLIAAGRASVADRFAWAVVLPAYQRLLEVASG